MAFVTGAFILDAPASALNNLGTSEGAMTENVVAVKHVKTKEGAYPYVSAQAFRYWLRNTLEKGDFGWIKAPVYREEKIAYTDANPILWWDDDLFGYMRAPSKKKSAIEAREGSGSMAEATPTAETVTRMSPFRVSTLVSLAPVSLTNDFGVMARQEGKPVPHEHQFYKTTLHGLLSLDLHAAGTFSYKNRTGYLNLDQPRIDQAKSQGLEQLEEEKAYRLPLGERLKRISALLQGLAGLEGGAKQALHYTDVSPDVIVVAVTKGGNNVFGHIFGTDNQGRPILKLAALKEAMEVFGDNVLSKVHIGWVRGYLDEQRDALEAALSLDGQLSKWRHKIDVAHPRVTLASLVEELKAHEDWLR